MEEKKEKEKSEDVQVQSDNHHEPEQEEKLGQEITSQEGTGAFKKLRSLIANKKEADRQLTLARKECGELHGKQEKFKEKIRNLKEQRETLLIENATLKEEKRIREREMETMQKKMEAIQREIEAMQQRLYEERQSMESKMTEKTRYYERQKDAMQREMYEKIQIMERNMEKERQDMEIQRSKEREMMERQMEAMQRQMGAMHWQREHQDIEDTLVYDEDILNVIRAHFVECVTPQDVIPFFHKYNTKILTQRDIEKVKRVTDRNGEFEGAAELLSRLVRYRDWFPCLLQVLRDRLVKGEDVANAMEALVERARQA